MMKLAAVGLCAFSLFLSILSLALPYWVRVSNDTGSINYGLWSFCTHVLDVSACASWPLIPDTLKAVRAMAILGMVGLIVSLVCSVLYSFVMKDQKLLKAIAVMAAFAAGAFLIIGAIIFAVNPDDKLPRLKGNLHAAFALAIVAGFFALLTGGVFIKVSSEYTTIP